MHHALDETDLRILEVLRSDARLTNKQIAALMGKSVSTVFERIKRLEKDGVITQYVALIDNKKLNLKLSAHIQIRLRQHDPVTMQEIEATFSELPEVHHCFRMSGKYDYVLFVLAKDMDHYNKSVVEKLAAIGHIDTMRTSFILEEIKVPAAIQPV